MSEKAFCALNWHCWRDNPLDYLDAPLCTPDGQEVRISQRMGGGFDVTVGERVVGENLSNAAACRVLHEYEVGVGR